MTNKKKLIGIIVSISIVLFIGLFFVFYYHEPNILSSKDKKWISENGENVVSIDVTNDVALYSLDGEGIVFSFLDYVTEQSKISFNNIPYLHGKQSLESDYRFEFIDGADKLSNNQLPIYTDYYVLVSKKDNHYNSIDNLEGMTIGVLKEDSADISYYLGSVSNIKYFNYDSDESLFTSLDKNDVNALIIPNIMYLDKTINSDYYINYFFTDITKKLVLSMDRNNQGLNEILKKCHKKWFDEYYVDKYNEIYLDYYIKKMNINDKTKADLLSKTYVYGYVSNPPYEVLVGNKLEGIAIEYINRIVRLTNIDIDYVQYNSVKDLKDAIRKGKVDIYFDYIDEEDSKYLKTKSTFVEKYAVLGKYDQNYIVNTLESLKGKDINVLKDNYLYKYLENNSKANILKCDNVNDLTKDSNKMIVVDKELYNYYHHTLFKKYDLLYTDMITYNYHFMIKSNNESFYKLFDYIINTNSYYNYRNMAYNNLNASILEKVSFEELYLIILAIILIPFILIIVIIMFIKNKYKLKLVRREDRKRYIDMLTSLKNRNYLNLNIDKWDDCKTYPQAIVIIDLNNTKFVNDNYGREKGDMLIVKASSILINTQLENSEIIRSDGNEFLIYTVGYNENQIDTYTKELSKSLKDLPYGFGASIGYSMINDNIKTIDDAINEATIEMQSDKESYR